MSAPATPFDSPSFASPWSLRVFGVTLAAAEAGLFTRQEFQQSLIAQIGAVEASGGCIDSDESYYTRWVEALVELLGRKRVLIDGALPSAEEAVRRALRALQHPHDHDDHAHGLHDEHHDAHDHGEPMPPAPIFVEAAR